MNNGLQLIALAIWLVTVASYIAMKLIQRRREFLENFVNVFIGGIDRDFSIDKDVDDYQLCKYSDEEDFSWLYDYGD